jgi:hypothetical protein
MADEHFLQKAVDTAWKVYAATHSDVQADDSRRCLLERHLQATVGSHYDAEELACSGLAYLDRIFKC